MLPNSVQYINGIITHSCINSSSLLVHIEVLPKYTKRRISLVADVLLYLEVNNSFVKCEVHVTVRSYSCKAHCENSCSATTLCTLHINYIPRVV